MKDLNYYIECAKQYIYYQKKEIPNYITKINDLEDNLHRKIA
jgi:hypothetical protein